MLKTKTETIDGYTVTCTQHAVVRQAVLQVRVTNLLAPAAQDIRLLFAAMASEASAIKVLFFCAGHMKPEELPPFFNEVLSSTFVVHQSDVGPQKHELGTSEAQNRAFPGALLTLWRVVFFALRVNYEDFFTGVVKLASDAAAPTASGSSPTPTSSTASGSGIGVS